MKRSKKMIPIIIQDELGAEAEIYPMLGAWLFRYRAIGPDGKPVDVLHHDPSLLDTWPDKIHCGNPILFPQCGPCQLDGMAGTFKSQDQVYELKQHGFARRLPWTVLHSQRDSCRMELRSNSETLRQYPHQFRLELTYQIRQGRLWWEFTVENCDQEKMPFSAGFHPFIRTPLSEGSHCRDCTVRVGPGLLATQDPGIENWRVDEMNGGEVSLDQDLSGSLMITHIFPGDAQYSVSDPQAGWEVRMDYRRATACHTLVVWAASTSAPYVCVEPWTALPNALNSGHDLVTLDPGDTWRSEFEISISAMEPAASKPGRSPHRPGLLLNQLVSDPPEFRFDPKLGPVQYHDLVGKVVVLTGGANGIGESTVRAFERQGARVYFCDIDTQAARSKFGFTPRIHFRQVDLTDENQIIDWIKQIGEREGHIDILINNAAKDPRIPLDQTTVAQWDDLIQTNLRSYFLMIREVTKWMPGGAAIVNLSSLTFHEGPANMSAYVATKAGIQGLTRSLARELGPKRIRVNTVSPGWVMTERQLKMYVTPAVKKLVRAMQCIPDLMQPGELSQVILFLSSGASAGMTGQELLVDRGWKFS